MSELPDKYRRLVTKVQNSFLLTEREGLANLKEEVSKEYHRLVSELTEDDLDNVLAIQKSKKRLEIAIFLAIILLRKKARAGARKQLAKELERKITLKSRNRLDRLAAQNVADSITSTWANLFNSAILTDRDYTGIVAQVNRKIKMVATTETSQAWNDEHTVGSEKYKDSGGVKRWDSTLDSATCAICLNHDGEEVPLDSNFRNGDLPGFVHPNCRCISTILI